MRKVALVAVVALAAAAWVAAAPGAPPARRSAPVDDPGARFFADGGQFVVECGLARTASDDPIVLPGRPGASHLHEFFGSTEVDADSTGASLTGTDTTCDARADAASYWAPALLRRDVRVEPLGLTAYYRVAPGVDPTTVEPLPLGLAVVAGDGDGASVAGWGCGRGPTLSATPPSCPESAPLGLRVTFPDCWDGEHLDSADHRSHLAYSGEGGCSDDRWPVALPRLTIVVHYGIHGDPSGLALSSGDVGTAHADFLNGWDADAQARSVRACLHRELVCGIPESSRAARLGR
jgi:hypothetical protein